MLSQSERKKSNSSRSTDDFTDEERARGGQHSAEMQKRDERGHFIGKKSDEDGDNQSNRGQKSRSHESDNGGRGGQSSQYRDRDDRGQSAGSRGGGWSRNQDDSDDDYNRGPAMIQIISARHVLLAMSLSFVALSGSVHAADCSVVSIGKVPLNDLQGALYLNRFEGGLYPNGADEPPENHAREGLNRAALIRPLNGLGEPDADGSIVLLSVGMSNTSQEFQQFMAEFSADPNIEQSALIPVNGAASGQTAHSWDSPTDTNYDRVRDAVLEPAGLDETQVQVVWLKVANPGPTRALPAADADAFVLKRQLGDIARALAVRYPNLQMVFMSSRIYAGYATTPLNPEPYAYESGFAVKWVIEAQIKQMLDGAVDPIAGDLDFRTRAPWLAWGPYLWADGLRARSDGFTWSCNELAPDGTHPSLTGGLKVARALIDFFGASPYTSPWFLGGAQAHPVVVFPNGGEQFQAGNTVLLRWIPAVNGGGPVRIRLHGTTRTGTIATSTEDDGEFQWTLPPSLPEGPGYQIEVSSIDQPSLSDYSDGDFSIGSQGGLIAVLSPNGGESLIRGTTVPIRWSGSGAGERFSIHLMNGTNSLAIASTTPGDGLFDWTIPTSLPAKGGYSIVVTSIERPGVTDTSDSTFAIRSEAALPVTVTAPNGGETWRKGQEVRISWTSSAPPDTAVKIELLLGEKSLLVADNTSNDGRFVWTVPAWLPSTGGYLIEIALGPPYDVRDISNQTFGIE